MDPLPPPPGTKRHFRHRTKRATNAVAWWQGGVAMDPLPPPPGTKRHFRHRTKRATNAVAEIKQLRAENAALRKRLRGEEVLALQLEEAREQLRSFQAPVYDSGGEEVGQALPPAKRMRAEGGSGSGKGRVSSSSSSGTSALAALASATAGTVKVKQEAHEAVARARAAEAATSAAEDRLLCVVCQDEERSVVLVPCWHCALCAACAPACAACPICRTDVTERRAVVLS